MYKNYNYYHPIIKVEYDKKHDWWILIRGPETFYDEENRLRTWNTEEEALQWLKENHPGYEVEK